MGMREVSSRSIVDSYGHDISDAYKRLAMGIVMQACVDYRDGKRGKVYLNGGYKCTQDDSPLPNALVAQTTRFFRSEWGRYLMGEIDAEYLLAKLDEVTRLDNPRGHQTTKTASQVKGKVVRRSRHKGNKEQTPVRRLYASE